MEDIWGYTGIYDHLLEFFSKDYVGVIYGHVVSIFFSTIPILPRYTEQTGEKGTTRVPRNYVSPGPNHRRLGPDKSAARVFLCLWV